MAHVIARTLHCKKKETGSEFTMTAHHRHTPETPGHKTTLLHP
jgi:hypothetical protein